MTIKDIARISGYSLGTVSRVLNGHPNVSDKARTHILSIVEEYHYYPNENAKLLKQQASDSIAIIVRGTQNMLFADIIEQIQSLLLKKGEEPAIVNYLDEYDDEVASAISFCKNRHPKGLIFLGGNLNHFQESFHKVSVPSVLLTNNASSLAFPNLSSFTTDDEEASRSIIRYFVEHGHRNIAIIGGNLTSSQISFRRINGA
ncbi:MAG: LacI family DNA-binding transcriptional regulator, partial [Coprococcus catus]|nr:LacI family DNA-binding transcriptional regulator [Coprococcus catus]